MPHMFQIERGLSEPRRGHARGPSNSSTVEGRQRAFQSWHGRGLSGRGCNNLNVFEIALKLAPKHFPSNGKAEKLCFKHGRGLSNCSTVDGFRALGLGYLPS